MLTNDVNVHVFQCYTSFMQWNEQKIKTTTQPRKRKANQQQKNEKIPIPVERCLTPTAAPRASPVAWTGRGSSWLPGPSEGPTRLQRETRGGGRS